MSQKTAIYHQPPHLQDRELFVAAENPDGTVDLHDKDGVAIVTSCPVVDEPAVGACTIPGAKPAKEPAKEPAPSKSSAKK